jgi:hypothetical protein
MQIRTSIGGKAGLSRDDLRKFLGIKTLEPASEHKRADSRSGMEREMRQGGKE